MSVLFLIQRCNEKRTASELLENPKWLLPLPDSFHVLIQHVSRSISGASGAGVSLTGEK
jgi:hypothetical protein